MAYVSEDNRAMLRAVHWDIPLQTVFDQKLVLAKVMPVEEMDTLAWRQLLIDNDDADQKILEPGKWDIGTDFPEVGLSELAYQSGVIDGVGIMVKFDAKRIYYNDGVLDIQDAQRRILRKWAKKVERDVFTDLTNNRATAKGTQFDSVLSEMSGGIATGSQKHLIFSIDAGKAWNKEGDAVQQMREYATAVQSINRLASLGGDIENDPRTSTIYLDPLAYGALHDQLRDADLTTQSVGTSAITVPSLYGLTFTVADYAITNTGDAVIIDQAAQPMVYKQSLPPIPGFSRITFGAAAGGEKDKVAGQGPGAVNNLSLLVRDDDALHGGVEVRFAHLGKTVVRKPKSIGFMQGTYSTA